MRILVFSDSHKVTDECIAVIRMFKNVGLDMVLHAGDCVADAEDLQYIFPELDIRYVQGNNDFSKAPSDLTIDCRDKKIFMTHGHGYRVKSDNEYETLIAKGKSIGADLVVFGHTHESVSAVINNMHLLNPGSIRYGGTYGIIEIENGKLKTDVINYR